jgi:hypothetical protein
MSSETGGRLSVVSVLGAVLLLVALSVPMLWNRQPVLYSDSIGYFHSGYAVAREAGAVIQNLAHRAGVAQAVPARPAGSVLGRQGQDGISTARSVYYGVLYALSIGFGNVWSLPLLQALLTAACLMLAVRRSLGLDRPRTFLLLIAIALFAGLGFFAGTVMPDVFAGLMLLAAAMVIAYAPDLSRTEYSFWLLLVLAACLFHKSHLAILALALAAGLCFSFVRQKRARAALWLAGMGVAALLAHLAVDVAVKKLTGQWPIPTPFLLARLVGDGTAEAYLKAECPVRHFVTCDYLSRMPMTENDFLWSRDPKLSVIGTASAARRRAIAAEGDAIVIGTLLHYPLMEAKAEVVNVVRQVFDAGVEEFALLPQDRIAPIAALRPVIAAYGQSAIAKGTMPLSAISFVMQLIYVTALAGLCTALTMRAVKGPGARFAVAVLVGVLANAIVSGAISGVFDRYQGRVAWLVPLALAVLMARPENSGRRTFAD